MEVIIIQILLFQLVFWLFYELFLRKETFFIVNRIYLLVSSILSLVLPFIKLPFFSKQLPQLQEQLINQLPAVFIGGTETNSAVVLANNTVMLQPVKLWYEQLFTLENLWLVGGLLFAVLLVYKLIKIVYLEYQQPSRWQQDYVLVHLPNTNEAFSFFNRIFLGNQLTNPERKTILEHEKVHVKQHHSLDLLWFELLRVVFWFNPIVYLYQRRITEVHEYLVDQEVSKNQTNYTEELLAHSFGVPQFSLVNQFYKSSLIKNRIKMLTKEKSNRVKLIKYLAIVPMLLGMLFYVSCSEVENQELKENKTLTEEQIIKGVAEIVERTLPETLAQSEDITSAQAEQLTKKLKEYYSENKEDIENVEMNKYLKMSMSLGNLKESGVSKSKATDFMFFVNAEICVRKLIENIDSDFELNKNFATIFRKGKLLGRLKELNYQLPNEEEWMAKYKKAKDEEVNDNIGYDEGVDVPFAVLERSPIYPGCDEKGTSEELKKCFTQKVSGFVAKNFNVKVANKAGLTKGRIKISTMFKINTEGEIVDVKARALYKEVEEEAIRVISSLPKMKPGMHKSKAVKVPYVLPIQFEIK